jgi:hypothetical protein
MSNNNVDRMLSLRAATLSGNNNYGTTENNNNVPEPLYNEEKNSYMSLLATPLNLCLLISSVVILFVLFLLMVIYK